MTRQDNRQFHDDCRPSWRRLLLLDRSRAVRQMMGLRADLSGYRHDPKRQHPNHHDRRECDRQRASVPLVDHALIVQAVAS